MDTIPCIEPLKLFEAYREIAYSFLFIAGKQEYSFIGAYPHTILEYNGNSFRIIQEKQRYIIEEDIWTGLKGILERTNISQLEYPVNLCGFMGYFSYEISKKIEKIPPLTVSPYPFPLCLFVIYNEYIVIDYTRNISYHIYLEFEETSKIARKVSICNSFQIGRLLPECSQRHYEFKIQKIQNYILWGEVYEVNLSMLHAGDFMGDSFLLFQELFSKNPAPYSAYCNTGNYSIVSNSPEMFLKVKDRKIETRPIKGTRRRSEDLNKDQVIMEELLRSTKEEAELYMIVDLLRNDLGKVSKMGSVNTINSKYLETYQYIHHLIAIIESELSPQYSIIDLLKACLPGGSITGCPKIRCMQIIEELETYSRNLYTGSIVLMNQDFLISSIVIRTALILQNRLFLNSGGAITIDSHPTVEYQETLDKIKNFCNYSVEIK